MHPTDADRATLSRRTLLAGLGAGIWMTAKAEPSVLPPAVSLVDQLSDALRRGGPLLVMVSLEGCPFCKVARESYLLPLRREQGLAVVQLDMRSTLRVTDFQGRSQTHDELIRRWGVRIAPTVLFFGSNGREVAERLVGGYIPDFYGAYLEERLQVARASLLR